MDLFGVSVDLFGVSVDFFGVSVELFDVLVDSFGVSGNLMHFFFHVLFTAFITDITLPDRIKKVFLPLWKWQSSVTNKLSKRHMNKCICWVGEHV